jgi:hypothetical protein
MKKTFALILILFICSLVGCTNKSPEELESNITTNKDNYDPFTAGTSSEDNKSAETIGSISHGIKVRENNTKEKDIVYQGGELIIDYFITADGIARKSGFFVFVDGIPQPYKVLMDNKESDYGYLHELQLEDGIEKSFTFKFTPVAGQKGDTLDLSIVSITNPSFSPDMIETTSYGYSHQILASNYSIYFDKDVPLDIIDLKRNICLKNVSLTNVSLTKADKEKFDNGWGSGNLDFDKKVYSKLYINNKDMGLSSSYNTNDNDTVHIQYEITGHPGIKYKIILYYNHEPISEKDFYYYETELKKGYSSVFETDLDLSKIDKNGTIYILTVPINSNEFPEDLITVLKSRSIFFFNESNLDTSVNTLPYDDNNSEKNMKDSSDRFSMNTTEIKIEDINSKIEGVYYAGDESLFLLADQIYLYDITKHMIIASTPRHPGLDDMNVWKIDNGYAIVGKMGEESDEKVSAWGEGILYNLAVTFYNENLNIVETYDIVRQIGINVISKSEVAVSSDGQQIACIGTDGLYVYDRYKGTKKCIVNTLNKENSEFLGISFTNIAYVDNNKKIAFLSQNLGSEGKENQLSYSAYGLVNWDGTDLVWYKGNELAKLTSYENITLMSQDIALEGASGEAFVLNNLTQSTSQYSLIEKTESENIWGSEHGKYFITSVRIDGKGWMIRIYDMETGNNEYEKLFAYETTDNFKEPHIFLFEKYSKIIFYFKPMKEGIKSILVMADL